MLLFTTSFRHVFRRFAVLGRFTKLILCVSVLVGATAPVTYWYSDKDKWAPADHGFGPGKPSGKMPNYRFGEVPRAGSKPPQLATRAAGIVGKAAANAVGGVFGPA